MPRHRASRLRPLTRTVPFLRRRAGNPPSLEHDLKKNPLDLGRLTVETFEPRPDVSATLAKEGRGTACFELCAADPTSNPDEATCGAAVCEA